MRELIYISLLAGFCSGLAAALDRGLFALLFAATSTFTAYKAFRQPDNPALMLRDLAKVIAASRATTTVTAFKVVNFMITSSYQRGQSRDTTVTWHQAFPSRV